MREILETVWSRQPGKYAFVSKRRGDVWEDIPLDAQAPEWPVMDDGFEWFFTPLTFTVPQRGNEFAAEASVLFADLDPVDPRSLSMPPTLAWETSPGRYQALWFLLNGLGYSYFANLNKRVTMLTGADQGGWMGSKVLRVPGTVNYKYDPPVRGNLLWWDPVGALYSVPALEKFLPAIPNRPDQGVSAYPEPDLLTHQQMMADLWPSLSLSTQAMLAKKLVPDRSLHIVRTINMLLKDSVSPESVFQLIWWRPWCKWRTDRTRPDQLWAEISRAQVRAV